MKGKYYLIFFVVLQVVITSFLVGCTSSNVTAEAISVNYEYQTIEARVGDTVCLETNPFCITPHEVDVKGVFSSSNPSIATVNALTGEVNCLRVGTVTIYGYIKKPDNTMVSDSFTLIIREQLFYATGFSLQNEQKITLGLEEDNCFNPITYVGQNVNVFPAVSYSNSEVASYNYQTGKITPLQIGTTAVYVTLELENGYVTKQFTIEVVQKMSYIDIQTNFEFLKDAFEYITFQIIDNTQENSLAKVQKVNIEVVTNAHLIEVVHNDFQAILIKTKQEAGTVILKLSYVNDVTITKTIGITIK